MIIDEFVCPVHKSTLKKDAEGNLHARCCPDRVFELQDGSYDFAFALKTRNERNHYDAVYANAYGRRITINGCAEQWNSDVSVQNDLLLKSLGDITNKKVLLIGNGVSYKEFYLLCRGAHIVFTDLSFRAASHAKILFQNSEFTAAGHTAIEFHAVDALSLPFPDNSFDVIYGYAFVHHVEHIEGFFSEVARCLKPGGICRFVDNAYSPFWQLLKASILKPLQTLVHARHPLSPEDIRVTKKGGFTKEEITAIKNGFGFQKMFFERTAFLQYLWQRGVWKLLGDNGILITHGTRMAAALDTVLITILPFMKHNQIWLIWGFNA